MWGRLIPFLTYNLFITIMKCFSKWFNQGLLSIRFSIHTRKNESQKRPLENNEESLGVHNKFIAIVRKVQDGQPFKSLNLLVFEKSLILSHLFYRFKIASPNKLRHLIWNKDLISCNNWVRAFKSHDFYDLIILIIAREQNAFGHHINTIR